MVIVKIGGGADINLAGAIADIAELSEPCIIVHGANALRDQLAEQLGTPKQVVTSTSGYSSVLSDASAITYMLTHWTRDRTRGGRMPLPWAIKRLSRDNAAAIGLNDRGLVKNGYKADLNVIDYDRLKLCPPKVAYDLPSGGRRLLQRIEGYDATIVSGTPVQIHGEETGALPGRLVRGSKSLG